MLRQLHRVGNRVVSCPGMPSFKVPPHIWSPHPLNLPSPPPPRFLFFLTTTPPAPTVNWSWIYSKVQTWGNITCSRDCYTSAEFLLWSCPIPVQLCWDCCLSHVSIRHNLINHSSYRSSNILCVFHCSVELCKLGFFPLCCKNCHLCCFSSDVIYFRVAVIFICFCFPNPFLLLFGF